MTSHPSPLYSMRSLLMKKRTGLFPKGDWTHQSAAAAAYAGVEQEAQSDDDL